MFVTGPRLQIPGPTRSSPHVPASAAQYPRSARSAWVGPRSWTSAGAKAPNGSDAAIGSSARRQVPLRSRYETQ